MNRTICLRLAMIGVLAAAGLLSGCGRKGALDPPPGGIQLEPASMRTPVTSRAGAPVQPQYDEEGKPIAPPGQRKNFPADFLID